MFAPVIDTFLKEHPFADIFARDVLDHQSRELPTSAALSSMTGTDGQLRFGLGVAMTAFASLTRNAEEIEQAGNALNRETNQRRAQTDAEAISLIQTLANRKGPLSDALSAAARLARDSGQYATPTRQFVESVRRAIADGDFEGVDGGTVGSRIYDTPPSRRAEVTEEPSLAGFEEPTGHGPVPNGKPGFLQGCLTPALFANPLKMAKV